MLKIAHRGSPKNENTLEGFLVAQKHGFDVMEIDIRHTKDDVLVLCHDPMVNGHFVDKTNLSMMEIFLPNLLTLDSYFNHFPTTMVCTYVDIKGSERTAYLLLKMIYDKKIDTSNLIVGSFNEVHLAYFYDMEIKRAFITANDYMDVNRDILFRNVEIVVISWEMLSDNFCEYCRKKGKKIYVFTCRTYDEYEHIKQYDIDGIVSDIIL